MTSQLLKITWQTTLLWMIYRAGVFVVDMLHLPLPGNVVGMLLLFLLLAVGIVKPLQIEEAVQLLLKHFAFFFIPISVGLMAWGGLIQQSGFMLLGVLTVSAVAALVITGVLVQLLHGRQR